ncbi:Root-specific lectin [Linum perenne]
MKKSATNVVLPSLTVSLIVTHLLVVANAQNCGQQSHNNECKDGSCCSQHGWCGTTPDHCGESCQSNCDTNGGGRGGGKNYPSTPPPQNYDSFILDEERSPPAPRNITVDHEGDSHPQCGSQRNGKPCEDETLCCSQWGYCGSVEDYCGDGCQSGRCHNGGSDPSSPPPGNY